MVVYMIWDKWGRIMWHGEPSDLEEALDECNEERAELEEENSHYEGLAGTRSRKLAKSQLEHLNDLKVLRHEELKTAGLQATLAAVRFQKELKTGSHKLGSKAVAKIQQNITVLGDEKARVTDRVAAIKYLNSMMGDTYTLQMTRAYLNYANLGQRGSTATATKIQELTRLIQAERAKTQKH
jgi:hypothetical protein